MNLVNALSNPNAIGTRRRLKRINRRSATHKLANRWLKMLCMDLESKAESCYTSYRTFHLLHKIKRLKMFPTNPRLPITEVATPETQNFHFWKSNNNKRHYSIVITLISSISGISPQEKFLVKLVVIVLCSVLRE